jgi:hypothetical protein
MRPIFLAGRGEEYRLRGELQRNNHSLLQNISLIITECAAAI